MTLGLLPLMWPLSLDPVDPRMQGLLRFGDANTKGCMICVATDVIRRCSCRCHQNDLLFATYKIHAGNDGFNDLALANSAFPSNVEEFLVPLGGIVGVGRLS
jgi:hypothetical protein